MLKNDLSIENKIIFDEPMKKYTSFKIGGKADCFIKVSNCSELKQALAYAKQKKLPITIIGNGTNILVKDNGIRGIVIKIDIQNINIEKHKDYAEVTVGAGYKTMALAQKLLNEELSGFEELAGIPGTIGGAIYMNAGAYGKEIKDINILTTCMDFDGNIFKLTNKEQNFGYRFSIFKENEYIILETKLKLKYKNKQEIKNNMEKYAKERKEKQPIEYPSAGSTFKRKEGLITAKAIDECGLKGYSIGGAKVSEKHAGFIVNYDNATAKDVLDLIKYVKENVYNKYRIEIEEEIKIIGED